MTATPISLLRDDLEAANYTVDALGELWGDEAAAALFRDQRVPARRALAALTGASADGAARPDASAALVALARLFVLSDPVSEREAAAAFDSLGVDGAVELGLVERRAGAAAGGPASVVAVRDLRPYSFVDSHGVGSWWLSSDLGELALGHALGEDHVLGVGGASLTLTGLMIGSPVRRALDLGTGCGIQALHAARHAELVIATDISERALEYARFNAELNGIDNIEFRLGSLFEPVAGERFDHIVSNPPFVITPRREGVPAYEYRDGGMVGDGIVRAVLSEAAEHLEPGGVAQLLGNWEYHVETDAGGIGGSGAGSGSGDGFGRIESWLESASSAAGALSAWIVERERQDAATYAETWIRDGGTRPGGADFDRLYDAWLDDFAERGVAAVGFGYVTLRRAAAAGEPRIRRFERIDAGLGANPSGLGEHLELCLEQMRWQRGLDDDAFARVALAVAGDVTEERHYWPGADDPSVMRLQQGGGFGRTIPLDTALAAVVGACDGELSVAAICAALGQLFELDDAGEAALRDEVLPQLRALVDVGVLLRP